MEFPPTSMSDFARMSFDEMKSALDVSYLSSTLQTRRLRSQTRMQPRTHATNRRGQSSNAQNSHLLLSGYIFPDSQYIEQAMGRFLETPRDLLPQSLSGSSQRHAGWHSEQRFPRSSRRVTSPYLPRSYEVMGERQMPYNPEEYMLPPGVGMDEEELMRSFARQNSARGSRGSDVFQTPRGGEDYDELLALDDSIKKKTLSARSRRRLDTHFPSTKELKMECSICKERILRNIQVTKLPCSHLFHRDCIMKWFDYNITCPTCRKEVLC
mmetsp:Transcript_11327/g.14712  ORF Transcript_11327/g.14712 Transcript_11327/m.14712 type:complete len:268 (-) Transcript_11327:332-1135(-)